MSPLSIWSPSKVAINLPRECKFYLSPEGCKYGDDCRYGHYRERAGTGLIGYYHGKRNMRYHHEKCNTQQTANHSEVMRELPTFANFCENMEEKVCPFYLLHGFCRFLPMCMFLHPASTPEVGEDTLSGNSRQRPDEFVSFSTGNQPDIYNEYQDLAISSSFEPKADCDGNMTQQQSKIEELPEREVQHYQPSIEIGLPRRPDQAICPYYIRFGLCIKGQGCRYNHPVAGGPPGSDDE